MNDLLLITDIPRLRKLFSRLADDNTRIRIANNLEKGGDELATDKPAMVFVQSHLSGLSADIILMHLKKQLGRKRSRFILLANADQVSAETISNYQGYIDIAESDEALQLAVRALMATLLPKSARSPAGKKTIQPVSTQEPERPVASVQSAFQAESSQRAGVERPVEQDKNRVEEPAGASPPPQRDISAINVLALRDLDAPPASPVSEKQPATNAVTTVPSEPLEPSEQQSEAEQGIAYPKRSPLSVYSEFNSSFDSAVETMERPAKVVETLQQQEQSWHSIDDISVPPAQTNRLRNFLLWLMPVVVVVVIVTLLQQRRSTTENGKKEAATVTKTEPAKTAASAQATAPPSGNGVALTPPAHAPVPNAATSDNSAAASQPAAKPAGAVPETVAAKPPAAASRLTGLPDFIPRYGYDKQYGKDHPGWERYKGQVTEFKILRDAAGIKAIQVLDHGGNGVPESFMRGVIRQLVKNPSFVQTATEKQEGYLLQRGTISPTQDVVYYRDTDGGTLRGFVVTWR